MSDRLKNAVLSWRKSTLGPFSSPLFKALWTAALASNVGAVIQTTGASWSMTLLAPSPQMVALVPAAAMLSMVLLALPAGALADTVDRRALMLISQIIGACAATLLAALSFTHQITPMILLALTSSVGAAVALHQPAWQASLGDFVPRKDLAAAVSLNVLAFNTARSVGPAIAGAVIAISSPTGTFLLNAISFLGLIAVLSTHQLPRAERRHPPESMVPAMAAGVRFVRMSPQLQMIFLRGGLFGLGASALQSLLPLVARSQLGGGPVAFGALMGALGMGSFAGAIFATQVRSKIGGNRMLAVASVFYAAATLIIAISTSLSLSLAVAFIAGVFWIFVLTTTRTAIQLCSPRWVVGRAVALGQVASFGCMAIGSASWGAIAGTLGLANALMVSAGFLASTVLLHRLVPLPVVDDEEPSRQTPPDIRAPRVAIEQNSGPIVISIEYRVCAEKALDFLGVMTELGRARRRNGATQWSVQQDIDEPEVWFERIESLTWIDHLRRLDRYTYIQRQLASRAAGFRTTMGRAVCRSIIRPAGSLPLLEVPRVDIT